MSETQNNPQASSGQVTSGSKPKAMDSMGTVGQAFTESGAIGGTAKAVGGPFDKDGVVGKQFTTEGSIGGAVQDKLGGIKKS